MNSHAAVLEEYLHGIECRIVTPGVYSRNLAEDIMQHLVQMGSSSHKVGRSQRLPRLKVAVFQPIAYNRCEVGLLTDGELVRIRPLSGPTSDFDQACRVVLEFLDLTDQQS